MFNYWNRRNRIESKIMEITEKIFINYKTSYIFCEIILNPLFQQNGIELGHFAPVTRKLHSERFPN